MIYFSLTFKFMYYPFSVHLLSLKATIKKACSSLAPSRIGPLHEPPFFQPGILLQKLMVRPVASITSLSISGTTALFVTQNLLYYLLHSHAHLSDWFPFLMYLSPGALPFLCSKLSAAQNLHVPQPPNE